MPTRIIGPSIADRLARGVAPHQATGSQQNLGSTVGASRISSARRPPRPQPPETRSVPNLGRRQDSTSTITRNLNTIGAAAPGNVYVPVRVTNDQSAPAPPPRSTSQGVSSHTPQGAGGGHGNSHSAQRPRETPRGPPSPTRVTGHQMDNFHQVPSQGQATVGHYPESVNQLNQPIGRTVSYTSVSQPSSYLGRSPMPVPSTPLYPPLGPNPGNLPNPWPDISQVPLAPEVPPLLSNPPAYHQVLPPAYQDYRLENQNPNITGNWGNTPHPAPLTMLGNPPVPQVPMGVPYPPNLGNPYQQWPQQPRYPFPHNPQMKDAKLSKYDGKIPFRAYEVKVDLMAVQHRWDEATKITKLVEALEGAALKYYSSLGVAERNNYAVIRQRFNRRFEPREPPRTARNQLGCVMQKADEEVEEFAERVQQIAQDAWGDSSPDTVDDHAKEAFLHGVIDKDAALRTMGRNPFNLDAAIALFKETVHDKQSLIARSKMTSGKTARNVTFLPEMDSPSVRAVSPASLLSTPKLEQKMDQLASSVSELVSFLKQDRKTAKGTNYVPMSPRSPKRTFSPVTCFKCGGKGHMRAECPSVSPDVARDKNPTPKTDAASTPPKSPNSKGLG